MKEFKQTHMSREDRAKTEGWLKSADLSLARAEQSSSLAKELKAGIEATEQQKIAFDEAEQFRRGVQGSSKTSSALSKRRANPFSPERQASQLGEVTDATATHLSHAKYFHETADLSLRGKVTPTAWVRDRKKRISETGRKIEDLTENLEQSRKFLGRYSRPNLIEGRQEEK